MSRDSVKITIDIGPSGPLMTRPTVNIKYEGSSSFRETSLEYAAKYVDAVLEARKKAAAAS